MKHHFLIKIIVIFLIFYSCSDNEKILESKIYHLQQKAFQASTDSTFFYLQKAKQLASNLNTLPDSTKQKNEILHGKYFLYKDSLDLANKHFNKALDYSKKTLPKILKNFLIELSYKYIEKDDYLNSLGVLKKLEAHVSKTDDDIINKINTDKLDIFFKLKNYKQALVFNKKIIAYALKKQDTFSLYNGLLVQASLKYFNLNNKKSAYQLLDSLLRQNITKYKVLNNQLYQNYGIFKYYDHDYVNALKNYKKALTFLRKPKELNDSLELANTYANISEVCMDLKKYKQAKKYMDSVSQYKDALYTNLAFFNLQNKLRLAFETKNNFAELSQDLNNLNQSLNKTYEQRISKELTALKIASKKEKELLISNQQANLNVETLKRKQLFLITILSLLAFIVVIIFMYYKQRQLKAEKENIFMQQRLFRAQMNPHFTSNVLFTIKDLIKENKEKSIKYLTKFSRLLRLNLENSMSNYTMLDKEIEVLTKYIELQQMRFPDLFTYEIQTNDIETDLIAIPPMLIQPFVENAIKHAFKNIDYKGFISIELKEDGDFIQCKITDNGQGLQTKKNDKEHVSASTLLIKQLLKKMTHKEVSITNNEDKKGVTVAFAIPIKK